MKIISFAHTSPALVLGIKTVTRREWTPDYAARFRAGDLCQAWTNSPRVKRAERLGTIELVRTPYIERTSLMPDEDYEAEGFGVLWGSEGPWDWNLWKQQDQYMWVVRFRLVDLTDAGKRMRDKHRAWGTEQAARLLESPNEERLKRRDMILRAMQACDAMEVAL